MIFSQQIDNFLIVDFSKTNIYIYIHIYVGYVYWLYIYLYIYIYIYILVLGKKITKRFISTSFTIPRSSGKLLLYSLHTKTNS